MDDREEPSFDPRSWARPAGAPAVEPGPPETPDPPRRPLDRRWLIAGGGGVALLAAVGAGALALRGRGGPAHAPKAAGVLRRSLVVAGPADIAEALAGAGLPAARAEAVAAPLRAALGPGGGELRLTVGLVPGPPADVRYVEVRRADGAGLVARAGDGGAIQVAPLASDLKAQIKVVRGEMDANSFYSSAVAAGVTDSLISDFANAFTFDFDFQREIRPGDIFEAAFERQVNGAGEAVGLERLVYASLQTAAKSRALYRFRPPGEGKAEWFDGAGASIVRSLMRTPVEGARVSSNFGVRTHPVLGYTRMHKGTDFATPVGTPVYASGDGTVDFVGEHGGHGNYLRIRHTPHLQTAYAHLSAYLPGLAVGAAVRQGEEVARSGNTGLSSGPHLHYEVIVDDEPVDSMTYQTESGRRLAGPALAAFQAERDRIDALRRAEHG